MRKITSIGIIIILISLSVFFIQKKYSESTTNNFNESDKPAEDEKLDINNFVRYENEDAGYSFQHPSYFKFNEKSEKPNFIFLVSALDGSNIISVSRRSLKDSKIKTAEDWYINMSKEGHYKMKDIIATDVPGVIVLDNVDKAFAFQNRYINIGLVKDDYLFTIELKGFTENAMTEFIENFEFK